MAKSKELEAAAIAFKYGQRLFELLTGGMSKREALEHMAKNEREMEATFDRNDARIAAATKRRQQR